MGIANASSCFQRLLETLFADLLGNGVLVYWDDIVVYTEDLRSHELLLEKVLARLGEARLTLRREKCHFFQREVRYLGHLVSAEGVYPNADNICKVNEYPTPSNLKQLRGFMGLASYYTKFVKDFSHLAKPLTEMTKKGKTWVWGEAERRAFNILR